jgi:phosphocarrier protein HPr
MGAPSPADAGPVLERDVTISNVRGLHARAAKLLVDLARAFPCRITVAKERQIVDAKDIWDLMTLAAERGTRLRLRAEGPDAQRALDAIADLVAAKFHEGE